MSDLSRCVVLVPFQDAIRHQTDDCLRRTEALGVPVRRHPGCSAIDFCRSDLASWALIQGYESILFVDSDMVFNPPDALMILARPEPVVGGLYVQKSFSRKLNCLLADKSISEIPVGLHGRDFAADAIGAGFLRIRREALLALIERLHMPCCTTHGGRVWPFFLPQVVQEDDLQWTYLGEDYSFAARCRQADIPVILDTRIRLYHDGQYPYSWEDAVRDEPERHDGMTLPYRSPP